MKSSRPFVSMQKLPFSPAFYKILAFHLPEGAVILDPTPGEKYSWEYYLAKKKHAHFDFFPLKDFQIHFIKDDILNFRKTKEIVRKEGKADAVFFDPPYIWGNSGEGCAWGDVRREDYGKYDYAFSDVEAFMVNANEEFIHFLKGPSLLFLKYTDVFSLSDRQFHLCANLWPNAFSNFRVVDHYIIPHHHISPTAWQVKDRPCGIVNYTYVTVFKKKEEVGND